MNRLVVGFVLLAVLSTVALSQETPIAGSKDESKFTELAERYWEILKNRPQRGTAFDQWYRHYLDAGRLDELASLVEAEAKTNSDDFAAQMIAGLVYERRGQEDQAVQLYARAEKLAPDNYLPPYLRGTLLAQQARFAEAIPALARAITLDPPRGELLEIYKKLGRLYLRQGKSRDATATWSEIAEKFPGDRAVLEELAELLTDEEQFDEAMRRWEQVAALSKDDLYRQLLARVEIAQLRVRTGNSKDAITLFDQTLDEVDPDSWLARDIERRIEEVFQQGQDSTGLVAHYEGRLQRRADDLNSLVRLAAALGRAGKPQDALTRYRAAVKLAPGRRDIREALVRELVRAGQNPEAIAECGELATRNPDAADVLRMLGQLHLDAASPADRKEAELKAIETWKRIAAIRPNDPMLAVQVAEACRHAALLSSPLAPSSGRGTGGEGSSPLLATAEDFYLEAIRRSPTAAEYHEYLGEFLHSTGRKADAVAAWAKLAAPPSDTAENWHRLAEIYARFDFFDEAVAAGEKSLELRPDVFDYRISQIQWFLKKQDFENAVTQLAHLDRLADGPLLEEKAIQRRAEVYLAANRADEEIKKLQTALESGAGVTNDHWLLALLLAQKHRFTEASKSLELAMRAAPADVRLVKAQAAISEQAGDMAAAADQYRKLATLEPRSRSAHLEKIARIELDLGREQRAREAAESLIQASPSNLAGYKLRAEIAFRIGDPAVGLETLRHAVRIAPRDLEVRLQLARSLGEQRKFDEAMEHYWRAFETVDSLGDRLAIVSAMSELSLAVGRFDRVVDNLRQLRRRRDDTKGLTLCVVEALRKAGDIAGARRELATLLAARHDDLDVLSQLVSLAESAKDWATAVTYQQQIASIAPERGNLETLAKFYTLQGDEAEASKVWKRILTDTEDVAAWLAAVDRQLQRGNLAEALQLAETGIAKQPDDWRLLFRAALAQIGLGRQREAQHIFTAILSQSKDAKYDAPPASVTATAATIAQWVANPAAQFSLGSGMAAQFRQRLPEFNDFLVARSAYIRFYSLDPAGQGPAPALRGQSPALRPSQSQVTQLSAIQTQQINQILARKQQEAQLRQQLAQLQANLAQQPQQSAQQNQAIQAQIQQYQQAINQMAQTGPISGSLPTDQRTAKIESAIALFVIDQREGREAQWVQAVLDKARANPEHLRYYLLTYLAMGNDEKSREAVDRISQALADDPLPHVARICLVESRSLSQPGAEAVSPEELETLGRSVRWLVDRNPQLKADLTYTHGYLLLQAGRTDEVTLLVNEVIDSATRPEDLGLLPDLVPRIGEPALQTKLLARVGELAGRTSSPSATQYLQFTLNKNFLFSTEEDYVAAMLLVFDRYFTVASSLGHSAATPVSSTGSPGRGAPGTARPQLLFAARCLDPDLLALLEQVYTVTKSAGKQAVLRDRLARRAGETEGTTRQAYQVAGICVAWWSGQHDEAIKALETLSENPAGDPWLSLSLAQAHFDMRDYLKSLARVNQVRITSGILAAEVDELRTQIVRQLYQAGDREFILQALMIELDRSIGEPQLGLFIESSQQAAITPRSSARTQSRPAPTSTSAGTRKSATVMTSGSVTYQSTGRSYVMLTGAAAGQSVTYPTEFRVQLPLAALLDYAKEQQKLDELLKRAETRWEPLPGHSQLGALVTLARFARGDTAGAAESAQRWAGDVSKRQEHFANAEAWLVASACLRHEPSRGLGVEIARHVMQIGDERGLGSLQQAVLIEITRGCVAHGAMAEAVKTLEQFAKSLDAAEPAQSAGAGPSTRSQAQSGRQTNQAVQPPTARLPAASVLAELSDKLPPVMLPALTHLISERTRSNVDLIHDPNRIIRPLHYVLRTALPDLPLESRRQILEELLAMLFRNEPYKNISMYVPAGGDSRGLAGALGQAVIDVAKSSGDLERLRAEWDKHPLATESRTMIILRAAAADAMGDQKAGEKLLAQLGAPPKTAATDPTAIVLVPANAPKRSYGPEQALGPPDTPGPGDYANAWAPATIDGQEEWILLEFPQPIVPASVKVFENCSPGALTKVTVFKPDGAEVDAWTGTDPTPRNQPSGISVIPVSVNFQTNRVKLYMDSKGVPGWNEIDAVGLVDSAGNQQWASAAAASTVYGQATLSSGMIVLGSGAPAAQHSNWSTEQVLGPPNTPNAGDIPTAWTSNTPDGQEEWLVLDYTRAVSPKSVKIYETYNPGSVTKVTVFKPDGTEVEAWSGTDPTPRGVPKGISVIPIHVDFKTNRVKITINSKDVPGWNEFDAVGLVDESGKTQWATAATASTTYGQSNTLTAVQSLTTGIITQSPPVQTVQQRMEQLAEEQKRQKLLQIQADMEQKIRDLTEEVKRLREQLKEKSREQKP